MAKIDYIIYKKLENHYLVTFIFSQRGHIEEYRTSDVFTSSSKKRLWKDLCSLHNNTLDFTPNFTYLTQFLPDIGVKRDHKRLVLFSYDFGGYYATDKYDYGTKIIVDIEEIGVIKIENEKIKIQL